MPKPYLPVKLSEEEILEEKILETIIVSQELMTQNIQTITSAQEIKTSFVQQVQVEAVNVEGKKFVVLIEKVEGGEPIIVDVSEVPDVSVPEKVTVTTVNPTSGVMTTFTNDIEVMQEEKTFKKCVDFLDRQFTLTNNGFSISSETISRFQRIIEHHVRYVKDDQAYDFRVSVDQRTGASVVLETRNFTFDVSAPLDLETFET